MKTSPPIQHAPADKREHHWDALRAFLMIVGIPYHVAMAYRANDVWIVNAWDGDGFFSHMAAIIHLFRMPAFFIIAGYFAALLLARRPPENWLKGRFIRLGLPFLACLLTLNPLLNLLCELSNFQLKGALASWEANSLSSGGYWVRHLWFIIILLYLCVMAAMVCKTAPNAAQAQLPRQSDARLARSMPLTILGLGLIIGVWQAGAIEAFYVGGLATNIPQEVLRLDQLITYMPWFALGWLICRAPQFRAALHRPSLVIIGTAIASTGLYLQVGALVHPMTERLIGTIAAITITQTLIAAFKQFADKPHRAVQALVSGAFVIYLVHLPIMAGLVVLGQYVEMPIMLKGALVMALTLALSWGFWLIVRASPMLRLLYDGMETGAPRQPLPATVRASQPA